MNFSMTVHRKKIYFSFFEKPVWHQFFKLLNFFWSLPSLRVIDCQMPDGEYPNTMKMIIQNLARSGGNRMGVGGTINRLAKSLPNVIIHNSSPLFFKHLHKNTQR